ncbi:GNAT family N-acetyltransferase [Chryseobacterium lactis]|uniref:N-acetyltransferase n=1 Tax=Chryseobacterium lactis TaxID=1241981 RepID=A0A3G6RQ69_CHRLC|nr:GNAT family protein [Chryseobacterium lactis]AZA83205.1 N-acetyltransferase [Chryseobacterium lactis]AZB03590.1 N-acetyltransferase [Chryseobacterium lactis]PNW11904.1 GNAT family N-acetyltransferase [Chryseobacterium lactis]
MNDLILKSNRLTLRTFKESDVSNVHEMLLKPEITAFNPTSYADDEKETQALIDAWRSESEAQQNRKKFTFLIETTIDFTFAGIIGIDLIKLHYKNAETWYKLSPEVWGKGYATEALERIIQFGFEDLKLHRIEAGCAVDNIASYKVMEKSGMIREAHRRKLLPLKNGWSDNYEYAILEEDYFSK